MLTREWLVALTVTPNVVMTFVTDKNAQRDALSGNLPLF
jgi:hypothetical protein